MTIEQITQGIVLLEKRTFLTQVVEPLKEKLKTFVPESIEVHGFKREQTEGHIQKTSMTEKIDVRFQNDEKVVEAAKVYLQTLANWYDEQVAAVDAEIKAL